MELIKRKDRLNELDQIITRGKEMVGAGAYDIGKALKEVNEAELWREVQADSFEQYANFVHGFKKTWAYGLINMAEDFSAQLEKLPPASPTRLIQLHQFTTPQNAEELYHMALEVPAKAFDDNLRNMRGLKATDDKHDHNWEPWEHCTVCPAKRKVIK